jgi:cytoskeletal protein RodZ
MASYATSASVFEEDPVDAEGDAEFSEAESAPSPWYRSRVLLALWGLMVAILVVLIIYGLIELSRGGGGGTSTTTPSTTPTQSSTTTPSTTTTTPPTTSETSETSPAPPPETPQQTPDQGPPSNTAPAPAPAAPPSHHHHRPHIPSTITLPHTVITLPPGW